MIEQSIRPFVLGKVRFCSRLKHGTPGVLVIVGTSVASNLGTISFATGYQLQLSGSTLANLGTINLDSSTIAGAPSGSGLWINTGGNINGPGAITVPCVNYGGILSVPLGTTNIVQPFQNSGSIQLSRLGRTAY